MTEEIIDIIDETGQVLHQVAKSIAHQHGLLHKTVIGSVRIGDHWALVRQAADRQDAGQLVWPVGGHVKAGEADIEALLREAQEEIGIRNLQHSFKGTARFHRQVLGRNENHLFVMYEITTNDEIMLSPEVEAVVTFTETELKKALMSMPHTFGDAYYFVLEHFYPHFLPKSYINRWRVCRG